MLCSDDDWLIISTLAPARATAVKVRAAMPGTPSIPLPSTVTMVSPLMAEMAFATSLLGFGSLTTTVPG